MTATDEAEPAKPTSIARHAIVAAALACGIGLGAALGLTVFDPTLDSTFDPADTTQPVVMVPQLEAPAGGPPAPPNHCPGITQPRTLNTSRCRNRLSPRPKAHRSSRLRQLPQSRRTPKLARPPWTGRASPPSRHRPRGTPAIPPSTVDIDVPQLPQPEPVDPEEPQKPGPTNELGPISDLPDLKPQLPPKFTLVPEVEVDGGAAQSEAPEVDTRRAVDEEVAAEFNCQALNPRPDE